MKRTTKINEEVDVSNVGTINIGNVSISLQGLNALFLSERCGYTVVNTPGRTKVILTPPTYNEADKHMIDQQQ